MRSLKFLLIISLVFGAFGSFFMMSPPVAEAGVSTGSFDSVAYDCNDTISYSGSWDDVADEMAYVRVWDTSTGTLIDDAFYPADASPPTNFSGSFVLSDPLPSQVQVDLYTGFPLIANLQTSDTKINGLAALFQPEMATNDAGLMGPFVPLTSAELLDSRVLQLECTSAAGCVSDFNVYGSALVTKQQVGYASPNGEVAEDVLGNDILLLHDVDNDGADTYLIVDIVTGANGATWLGLFIGGCNPVYAQLQDVMPLNAIPLE